MNTPSVLSTMHLISQLISLAVLLQSIELFLITRSPSFDLIFNWQNLKSHYEHGPGHLPRWWNWLLTKSLSNKAYPVFLVLMGLCALFSFVLSYAPAFANSPLFLPILFLLCLLNTFRWLGSFNGGSDGMSLLILASLSLAQIFPGQARIFLGYLGVQSIWSYCIAGLVKLRNPEWRSGSALKEFLARHPSPSKAVNTASEWLQTNPTACKSMAWVLMGFETLFPVGLLLPNGILPTLSIAVLFHLGNFLFFGLNRFLFAWIASYPAIWWLCSILKSKLHFVLL